MSHSQSGWLAPALLCASLSCNMYAVDGIILIDQNRALAGSVTLGDAPGFPVTISVPGSYRLSGNLTVPDANTTAIMVAADNVTIDLNGFSIIGPTVCVGFPVTSCSPTGDGIGVRGGGFAHITVVNGSVRGMGGVGISLQGFDNSVEKVHANSNGGIGIDSGGTLSGNIASFNGGNGIIARNGTAVSGNSANGNGNVGIVADRSTVRGNTANANGSFGISVNCPGSVVDNTATGNGGVNLSITSGVGCAFANNAAP
jgi:hypothetical protein